MRTDASAPLPQAFVSSAPDIIRAAQSSDKVLIENVDVFDLYEGKGVPDGKKSLAIAVTLQPREKTLTR